MKKGRLTAPALLAGLMLTALMAIGTGEARAQTAPRATEPAITIEDVIRIRYIDTPPVWSPEGRWLAYVSNNQGQSDLHVVEAATGQSRQLTDTAETPGNLRWMAGSRTLIFTEGRRLRRIELAGGEPVDLLADLESPGGLVWAPDGSGILFVSEGGLYHRRFEDGATRRIAEEARTVVGPAISPDGRRLLYRRPAGDGAVASLEIMELATGRVSWRMETGDLIQAGWIGDGSALSAQRQEEGETVLLRIDPGGRSSVEIGREPGRVSASFSPSGRWALLARPEQDGRRYLEAVGGGRSVTLSPPAFELETWAWSPTGDRVLYVDNADGLEERHLYLVDPADGRPRRLTRELPGTNMSPVWSPDGRRIAFHHCGPWRATDIWVLELDSGAFRQLTHSMPEVWSDRDNITVPELVYVKGALGWDIPAWLFLPKNFDPQRRYPGIVWVHGGPIRQMRYGWHPRRTYSFFHSYHQRLSQMDYVVISVNFRGGIGYGEAFEQALHMKMGIDDVIDVIAAGDYLRQTGYVDPERVGVWGISYGGYMTLQALGKHPGSFSMGINVAGVVDWATQVVIYNFRGRFVNFLGGPPDESPEAYRVGSPITYLGAIDVPLLNLHGTADRNVPFSQLDELVLEMVRTRRDFEFLYYPGEAHMFEQGDTWRHALLRIERFFEQHLKGAGASLDPPPDSL